MAKEGLLIGGPLDGGLLAPKVRGGWTWVTNCPGPRGVIGFEEPAAGRVLYRLERVAADQERWLFAGHTHTICGSCGGMNEIGENEKNLTCELCAAPLERLSDRLRNV